MIKEVRRNEKVYQCDTTDLRNDYPTDCPIGSLMIVKNQTTEVIDHTDYFDGTKWLTI